jgi:hypothetical protein
MRQIWLLGALVLAGCQNLVGPFERRKPERVDDPRLPITEQQRRGRYAFPETSPLIAPGANTGLPVTRPGGGAISDNSR